MNRQKVIQLNGQPIPEGYILNNWFKSRFDDNGNVLIVVVGPTGSGKSYTCIRICEKWYEATFNKPFPQENIVFSLGDAGRIMRDGNLQKREFIIVEEAGVVLNSLDFQNKIVKLFHAFLQSSRCKNMGIIFNLPSLNFLTKTARILAHGVFQMVNMDRSNKTTTIKPFYLQTNSLMGKTYQKYLQQRFNNRNIMIRRITYGKPSEEILIPYEKHKDDFVNKNIDALISTTDVAEGKKKEIEPIKTKMDEREEKLYRYIIDNVELGKSQSEIALELGVTQPKLSQLYGKAVEKFNYIPKYLRKTENYIPKPIPIPIAT